MSVRPDSDVERALKAFGDFSLKYRSFGAIPLKFGQAPLIAGDPRYGDYADMPAGPASGEPSTAADAFSLLGSALSEAREVRVAPRIAGKPRRTAWADPATAAPVVAAPPRMTLAERALGAFGTGYEPEDAPPAADQADDFGRDQEAEADFPQSWSAQPAAPEPLPPLSAAPLVEDAATQAAYVPSPPRSYTPPPAAALDTAPEPVFEQPSYLRMPTPRFPERRPNPPAAPLTPAAAPPGALDTSPAAMPVVRPVIGRRAAAPAREPLAGLFRSLAQPQSAPVEDGPDRPSI